MIKENDRVVIKLSSALKRIKLVDLVGISGYVLEDLCFEERKTKGYLIRLDNSYLGEYNWFIPIESVRYVE